MQGLGHNYYNNNYFVARNQSQMFNMHYNTNFPYANVASVESSFLLQQRFTPHKSYKDNRPIVPPLFLMDQLFPIVLDVAICQSGATYMFSCMVIQRSQFSRISLLINSYFVLWSVALY